MAPLIDLHGQHFGHLTVVKRARSKYSNGEALWSCTCDCGARSIVRGSDLRSRRVVSCGCHGRKTGLVNITHGDLRHYKRTQEYVAWCGMFARCDNPGNDAFPWYGARGIDICETWRADFGAFLADMGRKPQPHLVLGRLDKNGDYEPDNCAWMDRKRARWPGKSSPVQRLAAHPSKRRSSRARRAT
jgi:hypothetical protein